MIVVVDYNVGNVRSVCKAFNYIGCNVKLSSDRNELKNSSGVVLPGVAAFGYARKILGSLAGFLKERALEGKPFLGICVGHQLLFDESFEHGRHSGLGLIKGDIMPLPVGRVIPHMGWNKVNCSQDMELFKGFESEKFFYFAHSYYSSIDDSQVKIAFTDYGFKLPASVQKGKIFGTQFHPEKSGPNGLKVLLNFADICNGS